MSIAPRMSKRKGVQSSEAVLTLQKELDELKSYVLHHTQTENSASETVYFFLIALRFPWQKLLTIVEKSF